MLRITLGSEENLNSILEKVESSSEGEVVLTLSSDSPVLDNILDLKFLKKEVENLGKSIRFEAEDVRGEGVVSQLSSDQLSAAPESDDSFGFVAGKDVAEDWPADEKKEPVDMKKPAVKKTSPLNIKSKLDSLLKRLSFKDFLASGRAFRVGMVALVLVAVAGIIFGVYWFFPSATVKLVVGSDSLVKTVDLIASPSATSVDIEARVIPGVVLETSVKKYASVKASGEEVVGKKAIGEVWIYNKTDGDKSFGEGVVLTKARVEGEDFKFILNEGVSVPARVVNTSPEGETYTYGKVAVGVTAELIGAGHNLDADETLSVGDHPTNDFVASVKEDFSGGLERTITVVTASDRDTLFTDLKSVLDAQIQEELGNRIGGDQQLAPGAMTIFWGDPIFDREVGAEATEVGLSLAASATAIAFSQDDLDEVVMYLLADFVPSGYQISDNPEDRSAEVVSSEIDFSGAENVLQLSTKLRGFVIPTVLEKEIKEQIAGRSFSAVEEFLSSIPNIESYEINLWPPLPGPLQTMPHVEERIRVEIERK